MLLGGKGQRAKGRKVRCKANLKNTSVASFIILHKLRLDVHL